MNLSGSPLWVSAGLGLIAFIALAAIVFWVVRRMWTRGLNFSDGAQRGKRSRLGVVDAYDIDRQRRLILLRRDNVEHLVMIGGPNDILIEPTIRRGVAQAQRGQGVPMQQAPAPLPANLHPREVPPPARSPEPAPPRVAPSPLPAPLPASLPAEPVRPPQPANVAQRMSGAPSQTSQAPSPRSDAPAPARPDAERARRPEPPSVAAPPAAPAARSRLPDADLAAMAHKLEEALRRPPGGATAPGRAPMPPAPEASPARPMPAPPKPAPMPMGAPVPTPVSMPVPAPVLPRPAEAQPKPPAPSQPPRPPEPPRPHEPTSGPSASTAAPRPAEAPAKPQGQATTGEANKATPRPPSPTQPTVAPKDDAPDLDSLEAEMAKLLGRPPLPGEQGS